MYSLVTIALLVITKFAYGIDWNGNWALNCDFYGNDLTSAQTRGEDCGGRCAATPECTHFTWTNYNGGTCWMKKNYVTKADAVPKYDSNAVCGVMSGPVPTSSPGGNVLKGSSTRYWDCCKPSCSWSGKASVTKPVLACSRDGISVLTDANVQSGCGGGGGAFTCSNNQPWKINDDLSYGFAAARMAGKTERDLCCKCFQWTFTSGPVTGKKMIIQVTNTGDDLTQSENHFDLQIPGGGVGIFNGCTSQWGAPNNGWGDQYGGVRSEQECEQLPWQIKDGCKWRFQWFKNADNPTFDFIEVNCPQELTSKSGCVRV